MNGAKGFKSCYQLSGAILPICSLSIRKTGLAPYLQSLYHSRVEIGLCAPVNTLEIGYTARLALQPIVGDIRRHG